MPFILSWPAAVKPAVSNALVCQIDLLASFGQLLHQKIPAGDAPDSENMLNAFLGKTLVGRNVLVKQGTSSLTITKDNWKYIEPNGGTPLSKLVNIETGNSTEPQLYDLKKDPSEKKNLATQYPGKVKELESQLKNIKTKY